MEFQIMKIYLIKNVNLIYENGNEIKFEGENENNNKNEEENEEENHKMFYLEHYLKHFP